MERTGLYCHKVDVGLSSLLATDAHVLRPLSHEGFTARHREVLPKAFFVYGILYLLAIGLLYVEFVMLIYAMDTPSLFIL